MTITHRFDQVLVSVPAGTPPGWQLRPVRTVDRLLARLRSGSLDGELARGLAPEGRWLRAVRAAQLVTPTGRAELATGWANVLRHAARPTPSRVRLPIDVAAVRAAEALVADVIDHLRRPGPVPPRPVALVHRLLTDGTGPLYRRAPAGALAAALAEAVAAFEVAGLADYADELDAPGGRSA